MERYLVYHKIDTDFKERNVVNMKDYELVACIDEDWTENKDIMVYKEASRSTSVGDVIVIINHSEASPIHKMVAGAGFLSIDYVYNPVQFPIEIRIGYEETFQSIFDQIPKLSQEMKMRIMQEHARVRQWAYSYANSPRLIGHELVFSAGPMEVDREGTGLLYYALIDKGKQFDPNQVNMGGYNTSQLVMNCGMMIDPEKNSVRVHS